MKKWLLAAALALSGLGFTGSALAAPVLWTIPDTPLEGGGSVSGSFVYDPVTETYGPVSISTTAGTVGSAENFKLICTDPGCIPIPTISGYSVTLTRPAFTGDMTGVAFLTLLAFNGFTDPDTAPEVIVITGTCVDAGCEINIPDARATTSILTGALYIPPPPTAVPTLSQWGLALMALALGGITWLRRKV